MREIDMRIGALQFWWQFSCSKSNSKRFVEGAWGSFAGPRFNTLITSLEYAHPSKVYYSLLRVPFLRTFSRKEGRVHFPRLVIEFLLSSFLSLENVESKNNFFSRLISHGQALPRERLTT